MSAYVITAHAGLDGVRLSKPGHWGNVSFADDAAAERHAREDNGPGSMSLKREAYGPRRMN